jgi:LysM repeat protein
MTASGEEPTLRPSVDGPGARDGRAPSAALVRVVCPYLVSADGDWRSIAPTRDHRCGATDPAAALALAKQRDLCQLAAHTACATYRAARDMELAGPAVARHAPDAGFWPETRTTVLALEPAHGRVTAIRGPAGRAGGQLLLVALMVLAFVVLLIARMTAPSSGDVSPSIAAGAGASASAGSGAGPSAGTGTASAEPPSPSPTPSASPAPTATPTNTPAPTLSPSAKPTATPLPQGSRRYTVKPGDTLSGIAARFHTTVKAIEAANGITNPRLIHAGQVLIIP